MYIGEVEANVQTAHPPMYPRFEKYTVSYVNEKFILSTSNELIVNLHVHMSDILDSGWL